MEAARRAGLVEAARRAARVTPRVTQRHDDTMLLVSLFVNVGGVRACCRLRVCVARERGCVLRESLSVVMRALFFVWVVQL